MSRFEELARRASAEVRRRADEPSLDLQGWQRRRSRRDATVVGALALVVVAGIVAGSLIGPDAADDVAVETTLPPDQVLTTTSVAPTSEVTTTTIHEEPSPTLPPSILGAGWEELTYGPIGAGRYRMATAWTSDDRLFLWGGHLRDSQEAPASSEFLQDGYLFDPATGVWVVTGRPSGLCHLGLSRAIPIDGAVIVHGATSVAGDDCANAARYDLATGEWEPIEAEFFRRVSSRTPTADTGELLVAPTLGMAFRLETGETWQIPDGGNISPGPSGQVRAFWTGEEVVVAGLDVRTWRPGDAEWSNEFDAPPVPTIARDHLWALGRLWTVNYQMAVATLDPSSGEWTQPGNLPLRFYECVPDPLVAGDTPVVRMCSGIAIWDDVRGSWIPVPLDDVVGWQSGTLVGAPDALYSVGRTLRRYEIGQSEDGSIVPPPTMPIGVMQMDLPAGWDLVSAFGWDQSPDGTIDGNERHGVVFLANDTACEIGSEYVGPFGFEDGDVEEIGPISVARPGRSMLDGTAYRTDHASLLFVFEDDNGSDRVTIECGGPEDGQSDAASAFAAGLWSPWEDPPDDLDATLVVTPQAGPSGTTLTLDARGFPVGWSEWWLIDEDGSAVSEIPSDFFPHDNPDFRLTIAIDVSRTAGITSVDVPPGTYRFAVDGQVVPGATFTKTEQAHPVLDLSFASDPGAGTITALSITNRGGGPAYLSDWWIVDEIPGGVEYLLPRSSLEPDGQLIVDEGDTLRIHFDRPSGCEPGELLEEEPLQLTYCGAAPGEGDHGDSLALRSVHGGDLVERVFVGRVCPDGNVEPFCGFATIALDGDVTVRLPADFGIPAEFGRWRIADVTLTPNLTNPREVLSLGTYPLRQGGDRCAQIPENALEDLGWSDAFVSVQRVGGGRDLEEYPAWPPEFTYDWFHARDDFPFWECLDRPDVSELYLRWVQVVEDETLYFVIVALGSDAFDTSRAQQVLDILNGLDFGA